MKKLITVFLVLSAFNHNLFSQITFEKTYVSSKAYSIVQTHDGGYVIGSLGISKAIITKTDKYGEIEWSRVFATVSSFSSDVIECKDKSIVFVTTDQGDKKDIFLYKLNANGELLWKKQYGTPDDDLGYYVIQTADEGFMLFGNMIIKTDKDGNLISQNTTSITYGVFNSVLQLKNGNYAVVTSRRLYYLNSTGEILWYKQFSQSLYSLIEFQDNLILSGGKTLVQYDHLGNVLWTKTLTESYMVCESDANNYVLAGVNKLMKLNAIGDTIWTKALSNNFTPSYIRKTSDNGYILLGEAFWILKTDADGNYKSILLTSPKENEIVAPGTEYSIKWNSHDISTVNIVYSIDKGVSWKNIASGISNSGSYSWMVPEQYGDYLLRVSDAAQSDVQETSSLFAVTYNKPEDKIAVNRIEMMVGSNGMGSHSSVNDGAGFFWPQGANSKSAVFADGIVIGGKISGKIFANGNTYRHGFIPGRVLESGTGDNPNSHRYSIWKIRKGWESLPNSGQKDQYKSNYENWPMEIGAPYEDINKDGIYTSGTDKPQFTGDEVLWFVSNDSDSLKTKFFAGSLPVGLEIQTTIFGYDRADELGDVVFKKHKIINKSSNDLEDVYLSYFVDVDLGNAQDDAAGCDTMLNLGFAYNMDNNDENYYGINPPAIGYKILQGPLSNSTSSDSGLFDNRWIKGKRNISLSAFEIYLCGDPVFVNPELGVYSGTLQTYNNQLGKHAKGSDIVDPITNKKTKFAVSGDPVSGTGWYEGKGWPGNASACGDRLFLMSAGPFNLAPHSPPAIVTSESRVSAQL